MQSFITGSQVYGEPTQKSDIDVVCFMDNENFNLMEELEASLGSFDKTVSGGYDQNKKNFRGSMRFGNLNLIICTSQREYDAWFEGTERLKKMAPVSKEVACKVFNELGLGTDKSLLKNCQCTMDQIMAFGCQCGGK